MSNNTVNISWHEPCPACGFDEAAVTGRWVTVEAFEAGNPVECLKCGHKGEIDSDGDEAVWVEWDAAEKSDEQ